MAGSGGQAVRRVGIEFSAKDNLSRVLKAYSDKLHSLGRAVEKIKRQFASLDRNALHGLSAEAGKIAKINDALRGTVVVRLSDAKAQRESIKLEGMRASLAARAAKEYARTFEAEETALHRVLNEVKRIELTKRRIHKVDQQIRTEETRGLELGDRRLINAQRLLRERLRTEQLEARIHRQLQRQSLDQERVLHLAERIRGALPFGGNLVGGGLNVAGVGLAPARGLLGLAYQPQHGGGTPAEKFHHYLRERTGLGQMNLGAEGTESALSAAEQVRQRVRGLDMADSIDVIKDLINITGSVHEATKGPLAEKLARFRVTNRVAYGLTTDEGYSAIKAAEMLTPQHKGMSADDREEAVASRLELINKVMGGSGGKIRPGEVLQFAKTANSAKFSLSETGIYHLAPILQELGGMRTGTSLVSLMQNLANGRTTHASAQNLLGLGLLDPRKVEYDKIGRVKRVLPGSTVDSDLLREDPVAWVNKNLLPKLRGKTQSKQDELINSILSNRTAAGLVATVVAQNERIRKDTGLYRGARSIDEGDEAQRDNFLRAETDYQKALDSLRQKSAIVILPSLTRGLNSLTGLLEWFSKTIEANPLLARIGAGGIAGGGALAAAAGTVAVIVGTIRAIGALGGAARVLGLVAAELAAINAQGGLKPGIPLTGGAGAAGAAGAAGGAGAAGARGRLAAAIGGRVAALGALAGTPVAAAGAGPIGLTLGAGAALGVGSGLAIQNHLERTGAADAIQTVLAGGFASHGGLTPQQQRQLEARLMRRNLERTARQLGSGGLTLVVNGPIHATSGDAQGLVRDIVRSAARSGTTPRSGRLSNFAYPQ